LITLVRVEGSGRWIPTATGSGGGGEVNGDGDVLVINVGDGPAHKHQWAMGEALLYSLEAISYGKEVTGGDRDDDGREAHRRSSGQLNWSLRKSIEGWVSFTRSRRRYCGGCCGLRMSGVS
jgi:hypothetical protein